MESLKLFINLLMKYLFNTFKNIYEPYINIPCAFFPGGTKVLHLLGFEKATSRGIGAEPFLRRSDHHKGTQVRHRLQRKLSCVELQEC